MGFIDGRTNFTTISYFFYQNQRLSNTNSFNLKSREGFVTLPNSKFKDGLQIHPYLLMPKW
ncbi:hypothetical protein BROOK1789C_1979 [Bathymodiolus brooksi thiotrophic gill symbiont]|nr:hypothetical protein BROOK1789C_1979 [Bathymodiolus brooksi thiotrophic gill symbiont]